MLQIDFSYLKNILKDEIKSQHLREHFVLEAEGECSTVAPVYGLLSSLRVCAPAPQGAHLDEQVRAGVSARLLSDPDPPPGQRGPRHECAWRAPS